MQNDTMQGLSRTDYCGTLREEQIGQDIVVCGFVQKVRDKGSLVFVDLRDRTGVIQLVFDDNTPDALRSKAAGVRAEYVLMAKGILRERLAKNPELATGGVEVFVDDLRILSRAKTPPFEVTDQTNVNEELRLRYRYLDLRRGQMQKNLMLRHKIVKFTRDFFDRHDFIEIETPMLIKSTPEGARDYLVPSRVHPGSFYALPQSPQIFKQLLMLSGYDKYMQIAKCFRDEDLRADRQPEFTQIDLEMSFVNEENIYGLNEAFISELFEGILGVELPRPFKRLSYTQAIGRYGSDKPDTRFGLELVDLSDCLRGSKFKVFAGALAGGGSIKGINVKGAAAALTRKEIDKLTEVVKTYRAGGLAFARWTSEGVSSSYEKFLSEDEKVAVRTALNGQDGDLLLIVADPEPKVVWTALGALRLHLAEKLGLIPEDSFEALWVVDFPLLEYDPESGRYMAMHHPFTSPKAEDTDKLESDPGSVRARAYDMVLNGSEIGGGSIRISDPVLQQRMFAALGMDQATQQERFGFLLGAFEYGVPPHGGIAFGLDRLSMIMSGSKSIRDVIAFPKVQNASDLMSDCPSPVDTTSLDELGLRLNK